MEPARRSAGAAAPARRPQDLRRTMAEPIPFSGLTRDPREVLYRRLQQAPQEHAEALLDAYTILQELRDKGILEIVKGALGSGEKVLETLTKTISSDESVRTIRNLVILLKIVGSLEPEVLEKAIQAFSESASDKKKPPGLLPLLLRLGNAKSRRVLGSMTAALESLGENLGPNEAPTVETKAEMHRVTRHGD